MALPLDVLEKAMNQKLSLLLKDGRIIEGKLTGYDEYMNMVLEDVEETIEENKLRIYIHFAKKVLIVTKYLQHCCLEE